MKLRDVPLPLLCSFLLIIGIVTGSGCANIIPPTGGPRDTLPPVLLTASPVEFSKHVSGNKIVLKFDEYLKGDDIRTELVVDPVPKVEPTTDVHLQTLTIKLKDTLQPNTTYTLNFYKGIKDANEGNILRNFTYVFSTGDRIDSGTLGGFVFLALTGKPDSSIVVVLHKKLEDSAVFKDRPRYLTKVDSTGHFLFEHIQPGQYAVYAMKDEGGSHKYLSRSQLFAFADAPVNVTAATGFGQVILYAYSEEPESKSASRSGSGTAGTNGGTASQTKPTRRSREKDKRLELETNTANGVFDILDTFRLSFPVGLKSFDSTLIRFTDEGFRDISLRQYLWVRDTTNKHFYLSYRFPLDTRFNLIIPKAFGEDSAGRRLLKDDTIAFRTKKDIDYGEVQLRFFNLDLSRKPVLLFYSGDALKYSYPFPPNKRTIRQVLFKPGDYELRILYDTNGNGKWDTGHFFGKRSQPEKVVTVMKKFTVKANWDNDRDINMAQ